MCVDYVYVLDRQMIFYYLNFEATSEYRRYIF